MTEEIIDGTATTVDGDGASIDQDPPAPGTEANTDGSSASEAGDKIPWDDDPRWKAWRGDEKKVNEIMEAHDFDNIDDMISAVAQSKQLQDKLGTEDIETLLEAGQADSAELKKIKTFWAEQDLLKKKEDDPDAYTAELEKKIRKLETSSKEELETKSIQEQNDRYLTRYNSYTDSFIETQENMTPAEKEFLGTVLKHDSFLSDTDINNKASIKGTLNKVASMMSDMRQAIIEEYRQGKIDTPKISSTDTTPTTIKEKTPDSFEDAKKKVIELLKERHGA